MTGRSLEIQVCYLTSARDATRVIIEYLLQDCEYRKLSFAELNQKIAKFSRMD